MPVKLMWHRTDDIRHGRVHPQAHHHVQATYALGNVLTFQHHVASVETDFRAGLGEILTAVAAQLPLGLGNMGFAQTVFLTTIDSPYNFGVTSQAAVGLSSTPTSSTPPACGRCIPTTPAAWKRSSLTSWPRPWARTRWRSGWPSSVTPATTRCCRRWRPLATGARSCPRAWPRASASTPSTSPAPPAWSSSTGLMLRVNVLLEPGDTAQEFIDRHISKVRYVVSPSAHNRL